MTVPLDPARLERIIEACEAVIAAHERELTELDSAIGDADHGINMARGFKELRLQAATIAAMPLPKALEQMGRTLLMKVGGASGPLFATLLMEMGKAAPDTAPSAVELARMLDAGVAGVMRRGRSQPGEKTMLEVLVPLADAVRRGDPPDALRRVAAEGVAASVPLRATKGRASFVGERSIGHVDPGCRSCELLLGAILDGLGA